VFDGTKTPTTSCSPYSGRPRPDPGHASRKRHRNSVPLRDLHDDCRPAGDRPAVARRVPAGARGGGYGRITTEIKPAGPFYYAEGYHQQYCNGTERLLRTGWHRCLVQCRSHIRRELIHSSCRAMPPLQRASVGEPAHAALLTELFGSVDAEPPFRVSWQLRAKPGLVLGSTLHRGATAPRLTALARLIAALSSLWCCLFSQHPCRVQHLDDDHAMGLGELGEVVDRVASTGATSS